MVEDDLEQRMHYAQVMSIGEYQVTTASDAGAAVADPASSLYDRLLIGEDLPMMSGT